MIHGLDNGFLVAAEAREYAAHTDARATPAQVLTAVGRPIARYHQSVGLSGFRRLYMRYAQRERHESLNGLVYVTELLFRTRAVSRAGTGTIRGRGSRAVLDASFHCLLLGVVRACLAARTPQPQHVWPLDRDRRPLGNRRFPNSFGRQGNSCGSWLKQIAHSRRAGSEPRVVRSRRCSQCEPSGPGEGLRAVGHRRLGRLSDGVIASSPGRGRVGVK